MASRWACPSAIRFSISAVAARNTPVPSPIGPTIWAPRQCRRWSTNAARSIRRRGFHSPAPAAMWAHSRWRTSSLRTPRATSTTSSVPTSPEHNENVANNDLAVADFEGIVVHCAKGSTLCGGSAHAATDKLPDEPGSYNGFQALFGNKYVAPALNHSSSIIIKDFDGVAISDGPGGT